MLSTKLATSSHMLRVAKKYLESGGTEPIDLDALTDFAIEQGDFDQKAKTRQLCKRAFSRAFREQYHTDPQGRAVRTYHAVTRHLGQEQKVLWADMRTADADYMQDAFVQRRRHITGECRQLKRDVDSFNDNNSFGAKFQLVLDFRDDVAEGEQPTTYQPKKPR